MSELVGTGARVISRGVDTLAVNAFYVTDKGKPYKRELEDSLVARLNEWKYSAQAVHDDYPTSWVFNGRVLHLCPNGVGRGQWPWMLKSRDVTLYISNGHWNGIASVRLSSEYLWSCPDLLAAVRPVHTLLAEVFGNEMYLQVSLLDVCVDVGGWSDVGTLDHGRDFVSRIRKRRVRAGSVAESSPEWADSYSEGLKVTGFDFGRDKRGASGLSCRIYDKTCELAHSGKDWFREVWRSHGWTEEDGKVWRVEFSFKREALHELMQEGAFHGVEDVYTLPDVLPVLWAYAAGHAGGGADGLPDGWLRCVVPTDDSNRSRWPTHPVWEVIQRAFVGECAVPGQFGEIIRQRWQECSIEKGLEAVMGYLTSIAAWAGGELAEEEVDLSVVLHWLMGRGSDYLKRTERDFAEEVQRKRVKLGLQAS